MSREPFTMPAGYNSWKLRNPWDETNSLDEAISALETQHKTISALVNLLDECASHFEETGARPELLARINDALEQL